MVRVALFNRGDHYYWLTAVLAERGLQTLTSRVIAAVILGLGAVPVILIGSATGPHRAIGVGAAVVIGACCVAMAGRWLWHRWPTRLQSELFVVAGTLCVAAACLIASDPLVGMVGATAFAVLSTYTALFHPAPYLAFSWTVAAIAVAITAARLAARDPVLAIGTVITVVLINIFVAFTCRVAVSLIRTKVRHEEIEPLTGLLNRSAFDERAATLLGSRSRDDDRYFVVVVVSIDSFSLLGQVTGAAGADRSRVAVGHALRETVRHDAVVAHVSDADFLIADTFTEVDPAPLVERIRGAMRATPTRLTASLGVVSTPLRPLVHRPPHDVLDEVITIATAAMYEARRAGGNEARYVLRPVLTSLDDPDDKGASSDG